MTHRSSIALVASVAMSLLPAIAQAQVMFSNFGPSQSYNPDGGNFVGNAFDGNNYAESGAFTPLFTGALSSLDIALSLPNGAPNTGLIINIQDDLGGQPGAIETSILVTDISSLQATGGNNSPLVVDASLGSHPGVELTALTQYWLTVSAVDSSDSYTWNWNTVGDPSPEAISTDGGASWFSPSGLTPGAFEVDATAVPEPNYTFATALLLPFVMIYALRKSRKNQTA